MGEHLAASSPLGAAQSAALPPATTALTVRVVQDLRVLALRHLTGGMDAIAAALAALGVEPLPRPGAFHGADPWLLWSGPAEFLLLTSHGAVADAVLQALAPGRVALACALDQSAGQLAFELLRPAVADVLPRLLDASAIPQQPGQACRARLMDISAVVMRLSPERAWLLVDRSHSAYTVNWLARVARSQFPRCAMP
jgi:heterotetrameric sarcosine oxidase gamma subunit